MKAVFFDLVGTLVRPRASIGEQYAAMARRHGVVVDPVALEGAFVRAMASTTPAIAGGRSPGDAAAGEREWWHRLVAGILGAAGERELVCSPGRYEQFFEDLYRHFTTADAWELYPDVLPALDALRTNTGGSPSPFGSPSTGGGPSSSSGGGLPCPPGVVTGLVTNYDSRIHALLAALGLDRRFDSVTIPAVAGAQKPDPAIFSYALRRHGLDAAHAGHIGDSLEDDYLGARAAGMRAVLLDRDRKHTGVADVPCAATLEEAVGILLAP